MDRRTYQAWLSGHRALEPVAKKVTGGAPRYCHACGTLLQRRQVHRYGTHYSARAARTESKQNFLARHFCNAVCRASCKTARIAAMPKPAGTSCPAY